MGTWLFEGFASVATFFVALPVFVPVVLAFVYRRYRYPALAPTVWALLSALYASALVAFTTFPLPDAPQDFCTQRSRFEYWRLTPGESFAEVLDRFRADGLGTLTSGVFLQVAFNVVFFVPLGFLVAYVLRRSIGWALVIGLGTSLLIETAQGSALWGLYPCPYRVAEVDDLITNTSGALVGWAVGAAIARVAPFREPDQRPDLDPPTVRRRFLAVVVDLMIVLVATLGLEIAVGFALDLRGSDPDSVGTVLQAIAYALPVLLLLGVPMVRRDRATPGQWVVMLGLARASDDRPAAVLAPLVRFVVRWLPMIVLGQVGIAVVTVLELVTVAVRRDRRSLAGALSGTVTRTHDRLAAQEPRSADPTAPS